MRRFLAVLFVLVVAGCLENPVPTLDPSEAPTLPSTNGVFHRADGVVGDVTGLVRAVGAQFSIGLDSTEPTIAADADGVIYMTALDGARPVLRKSTDQGQTWTTIAPEVAGQDTHPSTFDPFVWVDRDTGRVFQDDLAPPCNLLSWSDDQGATWQTNPIACGTPLINDHQSIVTAKPRLRTTVGYPNLVYFCGNHVQFNGCSVSLDGGRTFLPQEPVAPTATGSIVGPAAETGCIAITGHLESDPEGRVFFGMPCDGNYPGIVITEDDGITWTYYPISRDVEMYDHDVDFASDEEGGLYAVWSGSDGYVWYSHSEDHGRTWAPALNVTAPGVTATMFSAVAAGAPGRIAIAYVGTTIPGGYEGKPTGVGGLGGDIVGEPDPPEWDDANWSAHITILTDAQTPEPLMQSVTANDPSDPLARGLCGRTRCHGMNDFLDITIDPAGRPWASFVDVCTKECVTDPTIHWDEAIGFAGSVLEGPALRGDVVALAPIGAPPKP